MIGKAPAPGLLGAVHGGVGMAHQQLRVGTILRIQADADAAADAEVGRVARAGPHGLNRALERGEHLGRDRTGIGIVVETVEHDHKFIAAVARDGVGFTHTFPEPLCHHAQHFIAGAVPKVVIDRFEAIQINQQQPHPRRLALGARQRQREAVLQQTPVGQAGQGIVLRQLAHRFLGALDAGNVGVDPDDAAVGGAPLGGLEPAPVVEFMQLGRFVGVGVMQQPVPDPGLGVTQKLRRNALSVRQAQAQQFFDAQAGHLLRAQLRINHRRITAVAQGQTLVRAKQGEAIAHVVDGIGELCTGAGEFLCAQFALGDVD